MTTSGIIAVAVLQIGTVTAQKEGEAEKQETRHKVEEDRKPQIEAAIVRIMKVWAWCGEEEGA